MKIAENVATPMADVANSKRPPAKEPEKKDIIKKLTKEGRFRSQTTQTTESFDRNGRRKSRNKESNTNRYGCI